MLPTIDHMSPGRAASGSAVLRRADVEKALEAYKTNQPDNPRTGEKAKKAEALPEARKSPADAKVPAGQDQAEINFTLSREEREAFVSAFNSRQDPAAMSDSEKETLRKASERISKFIDDAISRNSDNREKVEKAVGEWYAKMTKGEQQGPTELITLLRQAALGNLDNLGG